MVIALIPYISAQRFVYIRSHPVSLDLYWINYSNQPRSL